MPDSPPIIRVRNLSKRYGQHAVVEDVSFELRPGETLVLLGPSGCGKTTLLKTLNRLIEPDSGTVEVHGRDVRHQQPEALRRGIGYVIQSVGLLPHLTVAENVAVVPRLLGHSPAQVAARTEALLTRLHLPPARFAQQYPAQLSGGQQQRVGLARALAADPPIVLLDEPFGALDPITRAGIRQEFRELDELRRKTVVLVTHDVQEAFELADRILLLDAGRVQQLGTPRQLLFAPANEFVRRFFEAERLSLQLRVLQLADLLTDLAPLPIAASINNLQSDTDIVQADVSVQYALEQLSSPAPGTASAVFAEAGATADRALASDAPPLPAAASAVEVPRTLWVAVPASLTVAPAEQAAAGLRTAVEPALLPLTLPALMAAFGLAVQRLQRPQHP